MIVEDEKDKESNQNIKANIKQTEQRIRSLLVKIII
jgi:hypothetical protein